MRYKTKERTVVGLAFASVTVFIWGITFVCTKYLLKSFSSFEILFFRFVTAYAGLWIMKPKLLHISWRQELLFMLAGLTGVTIYQFMENVAISYTSASNVSIIVSISPIFTAIVAQVALKEKHMTRSFVAGFVVAIIGIALVSFNGSIVFHVSPKGDFLALAAAASWGFYSLFVSKINLLGLDSIQATRRIFFWAIVFMIPIALYGLFVSSDAVQTAGAVSSTAITLDRAVNAARWTNIHNWTNLLFLGLGASAGCFAAWNIACRNLGTVRATIGIYLIPVVTIVFAFFVLGERITLMGAAGAALTVAGLVISSRKS
ncbi:MAG: DMT family transporter [Treponema sp.]|nr:DMT family transporter [Treponema sp.]